MRIKSKMSHLYFYVFAFLHQSTQEIIRVKKIALHVKKRRRRAIGFCHVELGARRGTHFGVRWTHIRAAVSFSFFSPSSPVIPHRRLLPPTRKHDNTRASAAVLVKGTKQHFRRRCTLASSRRAGKTHTPPRKWRGGDGK